MTILSWLEHPFVELWIIDLPARADLEAEAATDASFPVPYYFLMTWGSGQKALSGTHNHACPTIMAAVLGFYIREVFETSLPIKGISLFVIQLRVFIFSLFSFDHYIRQHTDSQQYDAG